MHWVIYGQCVTSQAAQGCPVTRGREDIIYAIWENTGCFIMIDEKFEVIPRARKITKI